MRFSKKLIWYVVFSISIFFGFKNDVIINKGDYFDLYSAPKKLDQKYDFKFLNESSLIEMPAFQSETYSSNSPSQMIVGDLNNDGFDDFIVLGKNKNRRFIKVQMNVKGKKFVNDHKLELDIWRNNGVFRYGINTVAIADLDNDGLNDIVVSHEGCVSFLKKNKNNNYDQSIIPTICTVGDKRNINLVDLNNDGFIDLYFSSFQDRDRNWIPPAISNGNDGGRNILLINQKGKSFKDSSQEYGVLGKSLSWTAALADFNNDGYTDILDINDYGYNKFYENDKGAALLERTSKWLDIPNVSYSMSGEVADFNNDGLFDVYVSNTNRATFRSGYNHLLINHNGKKFIDRAKVTKTSACGWSWGTKAFEPNRDLNSAIFVVNSPSQPINQIERSSLYSSPVFVRQMITKFNEKFLSNINFNNPARFPEKNCLFYPDGEQYIDIAQETGITDIQGGKGLSEIDFNNDGVSDFLIANNDSSPILYTGVYTGENNWIGFQLTGVKSNRNAIGAVIEVTYDKGKKIKQLFPTNGYQSQSRLALTFGVPKDMSIVSVNIKWPSGINQKVQNYAINQYNKVIEQ